MQHNSAIKMKSTLRLLTIAAVALMALLGATACGGRGGALDKAIRSAMISGDTTRKAYDGICKLIKDTAKISESRAKAKIKEMAGGAVKKVNGLYYAPTEAPQTEQEILPF